MFGIHDPVFLIIFAVVCAIIAFGCYVAAQRSSRGRWIAGGVLAGVCPSRQVVRLSIIV